VADRGGILALALAPDARWLAVLGREKDLQLWDPTDWTRLAGFETGPPTLLRRRTRLVVAPDGSWLAASDGDYWIQLWDAASGARRHALEGHWGSVTDLAVTPDGLLCSVGNDCTLRVWDPVGARQLAAIRVEHPLTHVFAAGNRIVIAGDRFVYFFELAGG
jgi:WD40 repeat protein